MTYRYAQDTSQLTNLLLAQFSFFQRATHIKLTSRSLSWPKISLIIFVDAIGNIAEIMLFGKRFKLGKKFVFTEVTAIEIVDGVTLVLKFMCFQGKYGNTHLLGNGNGLSSFFRSVGGGGGDSSHSPFT